MSRASLKRCGVAVALAVGLVPVLGGRAGEAPKSAPLKTEFFKGKVVPMKDMLDKFGARLDPEAAPHWLALVADDGKVYPLIRDDGSRMFFKDAGLLNRPMRLTGRLFADTRLLQVLDVHSYKKGQLHEVYYWCDICAIRRNAPGVCECCGGPMELREVPAK
jgi:hypothetical protein